MSNTNRPQRYQTRVYMDASVYHSAEIIDDDWQDEDNFYTYKPRKALYEEYGWNTQD